MIISALEQNYYQFHQEKLFKPHFFKILEVRNLFDIYLKNRLYWSGSNTEITINLIANVV